MKIKRVMLLDGAMGTSLQARGLPAGTSPERWNLDRPEEVKGVHLAYLEAGAEIIETNTFGGNRLKLAQFGLGESVAKVNGAGVKVAREAISQAGRSGSAYVAGVIGPLGELLEPYGSLSFAQAREYFSEQTQALVEAGCDLLLVQTMSDLAEARQAVLAAKDLGVPVWCSITFEEGGRTLTGATPEAAVISLSSAGASVVGVNCSLGPREMQGIIKKMAGLELVPVLAEPNAGLPRLEKGATIFPEGPEEFARGMEALVEAGAAIIGGCCGTTPEHIRAIAGFQGKQIPALHRKKGQLHLASRTEHLLIGGGQPIRLIGERLNPTGRKSLAQDISGQTYQLVAREARAQTQAGADLLDINVGVAGIDQIAAMERAVQVVARASSLPLVLDSATPGVLEAGAGVYQGKALLNSVSAKSSSLEEVLPVAKKYGAAVIGLTLTDEGIPEKAEERLAAAQKIVQRAEEYGIGPEDIFIDCLTLTVGAQPEAARETLKAVRLIKEELGLPTVLGVSNISHGLPNRSMLNNTFLAMVAQSGLDAGILNPMDEAIRNTLYAVNLLTGRDPGAQRYLAVFGGIAAKEGNGEQPSQAQPGKSLHQAVISGDRDSVVSAVEALLMEGKEPLEIINETLSPALEVVGQKYEDGTYFLPNLLLSAETAQRAFARLKEEMAGDGGALLGRAVLATVEGDIHDIGKNIITVIMQNHGFETVDLGKDVPADRVVQAVSEGADILLLSALMTTTLPAMERTVAKLRETRPELPILVGGAVVTRSYAEQIGASGYAKDAVGAVQLAKKLVAKSEIKGK